MTTRLERLSADEGARLRAIRLRALADSPDAFSASLDEAQARPLDDWNQQARDLPTFVAVRDGADVGMVRGFRDPANPDTAYLMSLWVAPDARRCGVGEALVDAIVDWARANGFARLLLKVADHNTGAIALYERKAFAANGVAGSMPPPREHITEHQRELKLRAGA